MIVNTKNQLSNNVISIVYHQHLVQSDFIALDEKLIQIDKEERTLLIHAVLAKNMDLVSRFISKGAKVEHSDKIGWTSLHYAAQGNLSTILEALLSVHPAVDIQDKYGNTPLWRATFDSRGIGDSIKLLLKAGANPHLKNYSGISPYDLALTIANYDVKPFFTDFA